MRRLTRSTLALALLAAAAPVSAAQPPAEKKSNPLSGKEPPETRYQYKRKPPADGSVESATMFTPINPQYDRLALTAARSWQYEPARLDGAPVKFMKRIQVNIVPTNSND